MSYTGSVHRFARKAALLATAVLSSLLAVSALTSEPQISFSRTAQNSRAAEVENDVNGAAILAIALAGSAAIGIGLSAVVERDRAASSDRLSSSTAASGSATSRSAVRFDQANPSLQRKLLRLLHNDRGAAHRLFVHASFKYPGKTPDWYAEKIIYDLMRDRGKY